MKFDDATVPRRIIYQTPYRAIYYDLDGTLTGKGAKSWATPYYLHHEQPGCTFDTATRTKYNGIVCDNTVEIRRVAFHAMTPTDRFNNMGLKILRYDDDFVKTQTSVKEYVAKKDNYSTMFFKLK